MRHVENDMCVHQWICAIAHSVSCDTADHHLFNIKNHSVGYDIRTNRTLTLTHTKPTYVRSTQTVLLTSISWRISGFAWIIVRITSGFDISCSTNGFSINWRSISGLRITSDCMRDCISAKEAPLPMPPNRLNGLTVGWPPPPVPVVADRGPPSEALVEPWDCCDAADWLGAVDDPDTWPAEPVPPACCKHETKVCYKRCSNLRDNLYECMKSVDFFLLANGYPLTRMTRCIVIPFLMLCVERFSSSFMIFPE